MLNTLYIIRILKSSKLIKLLKVKSYLSVIRALYQIIISYKVHENQAINY